MPKFEIMLDSTADLDEVFGQKYDIISIPGHMAVGGKDMYSITKWDTVTRDEFYSALKANPDNFKTSPPSVGEMAAKMEEIVSSGNGVMYLTISGGLSGTYNFALQAKQIVTEKYPDCSIVCIDSRRFGPAIGLMAVKASLLRAEGKSLEETAAFLEENKNRYHQAGWLDDLSYVAKQGRLTHSKAFFGTLVGIKPIGEFDYNGLTTVLGKAKGEKKAYDALISYIKATVEKPEEQIFFIAHTNRLKQAEKFKELIEEQIKPKEIYIKDVFPACGINIGPGLMAAYYMGKEISPDLSVERDLIKEYIGG